MLATVHGDNFLASSETQSLDMFDEALEQFFVLKKMPSIGPHEWNQRRTGHEENSELEN